MEKLVSVIVPVYNSEKYLNECLKSIQHQSYDNIEVIVVDDGSTDSSKKIIDDYMVDCRFKCIYQKNRGVSCARNSAIKYARGEFIVFVDSDDYLEIDFINNYVKKIIEDNSDIVVGGYKKDGSCYLNYFVETGDNKTFIKNCMYGIGGVVWAKMYRKKILTEILFDDEINMREDMLFNLQLYQNIRLVSYLDDYGYIYRSVETGLSKNSKLSFSSNVIKKIIFKLVSISDELTISTFVKSVVFWDCINLVKNKINLDALFKCENYILFSKYININSKKDIIFFYSIKKRNKLITKLVFKMYILLKSM